LFTPSAPETPHSGSNGYDKVRLTSGGPLADVLNKVLIHVYDLRPLLTTADEVGLDVLSQILWPAISTPIVSSMGNTIFAAGRPDELHKVSCENQNKASLIIALHCRTQIHDYPRIHGSFLFINHRHAK
jgi:hypothetical protein